MVEVALVFDQKDFLADGYLVAEEEYPRIPSNAGRKKEKDPASSSQCEEEIVEEEENKHIAKDGNNDVNLSNDKIGAPGGSDPPLIKAHFTSLMLMQTSSFAGRML